MTIQDVDEQGDGKSKDSKTLGFQPSLKGRALRLLSQREHSRHELERKLAAYEQEPGELAKALNELQARDFINDERAIESVVHRKSSKWGLVRVKMELTSKGLSGEAVAQALAELRDTELSRAQEVWYKKFGRPPEDPNERNRQVRFLITRGFAAEIVRRVVQGCDDL
jgi:regulatory protein